jgi:ribonuclease HII
MAKQFSFLENLKPSFSHELEMGGRVAGLDEVGRGPLAGPVVAAAVILDPENFSTGLNDSKKLTAARRQKLYFVIRETSLVGLGQASVEEIDTLNILEASMLAMRRALAALPLKPDACLVDGNHDPGLGFPTKCLIKGDTISFSIAAASIIAKVSRDKIMADLAKEFPEYGWEQNAGYGVPHHLQALDVVGPTPHHRKSFAPVRRLLREDS